LAIAGSKALTPLIKIGAKLSPEEYESKVRRQQGPPEVVRGSTLPRH